jgi:hypothetical protein
LLRRMAIALVAVSLMSLPAASAARSLKVDVPKKSLTIDDHLLGHLHYPAVEQAEKFVDGQQGVRRPRVKKGATWGYKGCKPPPELEVGAEKQFWVYSYDLGQNTEITAVLAAKSPHGYLWVQKEYFAPAPQPLPADGVVTTAEAEDALVDWEKIYDIDRLYFGAEPNSKSPATNLAPGLPRGWRDADCDPHVSILNFPIDTPVAGIPPTPGLSFVAGYYSSEHEYPNGDGEGESPTSNQAEMFFMNSQQLDVGSDQYAGVIAHEFYHMIQFSNDFNEATWVNEGMADVAIEVNGFADEVQGHVDAYQDAPDDHLLDWGGGLADYGQAFLFFHYLFTHYGAPENTSTDQLEAYGLAELLTRTGPDSTKGITKVLEARPRSLTRKLHKYFRKGTFNKVFRDYLVANYLDHSDLSHGEFGYGARDVHVKSEAEQATPPGTSAPNEISSTVHPYGADYYEFAANTEGVLAVTVDDPVAVIPATEGQPEPAGGYFAWSNRADEMLTYLQRRADLRKATTPQLVWRYWYQIEEDWDYAYVRVSTDGGKTWEFQNTSECGGRASNPNGNNRAVTESGGITGDSAGWQECTLDLAAYAGKNVLVRFEYDTDQATTEAGYVVDDVRLVDGDKNVWPTTNFERKRTPFKFGGDGIMRWFRIKPLAKNKPLIQVVRISGDSVQRRVMTRKKFSKSADGLSMKKPVPVSGDRAIAIFSGITPIATDPFNYSYQLQ